MNLLMYLCGIMTGIVGTFVWVFVALKLEDDVRWKRFWAFLHGETLEEGEDGDIRWPK